MGLFFSPSTSLYSRGFLTGPRNSITASCSHLNTSISELQHVIVLHLCNMDGLYFIFRWLRANFLTAYVLEEEKRPLRLFTKNDLFSILESLMEHVSDIPMLFGLVSNFSAARDLYMKNSRHWLHTALQGAPDEFKPIMVALIVSHQSVPNDEETMTLFLDEYVDSNSPNSFVPAAIENPIGVLHKLCDAYDVEKFLRPMLVSAIQKLDKPRYSDKSWM